MPLVLESGIKVLPAEILSQIFEAGHRMTRGWTFAKCVSQVCRWFRHVSLRTPLLWTRVADVYSDSQAEEFVTRSAQKDLDVSLLGSDPGISPVFQMYSNRWKLLQIRSGRAVESIRKIGPIHFPRLKTLYHDGKRPLDLSSWHLPELRRVVGSLSLGPASFPNSSQLVTVGLSLTNSVRLTSLSQALHSMTALKNLTLTLSWCTEAWNPPTTQTHDRHSVHIESLEVSILNQTKPGVVEDIFDVLSYLSPSTVTIKLMDFPEPHSCPEAFFCTLSEEMFPYGSTIKIYTRTVDFRKNFMLLTNLVRGCNIAQRILIEAPTA
ncbi:hypothetical protein BD410DRAFT_262896 [Rickenella mellea]|uniref:Uncharacterized protein n=1 Tax=Rickenella mellea TaxID=50990 RepID=A0A4Y7Q6J8_9AGAM|nr:hypothetical protein BD410DRAFT_262896 [Rickenella mellea]